MTKHHIERIAVVVDCEIEKLVTHLENTEPDDADIERLHKLIEIDKSIHIL